MAIIFAPTTVPMGDWSGVFQEPKRAPAQSPHPSESETSLTRVNSSHSGGSRSEKRQSKSLRNIFSKSSSKNKTYTPPIPEIGAAADRLPYNEVIRHRVELTPTELSDDISISRTSTIGGSSLSSGASFIDSPSGSQPPQMSEKLARVFGTNEPFVGPKGERLHLHSEEKPATRKRDSLLAALPKRSLERPPTSAGPVISGPLATAPPAKWEPPPFFKGLSGAVKHGSLMTCGVGANAVIYLSTHDKNGKNVAVTGFGSDPVKAEKAKEKHRQRVVETLARGEWKRKIFVLTSAGHLLQFSCDGAFNRLPEQSIRLSRHSVAFASDVIPGRHWVIQISTVYDALSAVTPGELSATPAPPAKQRPGSKSTYVKPIKQFLLIMDNGEDLDAWLTAVRHEIDVLGGKATNEPSASTHLEANNHHEISRSPLSETTNAFPVPVPNNEPLYSPHVVDDSDPLPWESDERTAELPPWPADITPQTSRATNTLSSTQSIEEHLLDSLRDSHTFSQRRSSGGRTFFTSPSASRNPSPNRSPVNEKFPNIITDDEEGRYGFGEFGQPQHQQQRPNAAGIRERRQSAQGARPPVLDAIIAGTNGLSLELDNTSDPSTPTNDNPPRRPSRRTPPTALKTRLSIVEDQPSPSMLSDELMDEVAPTLSPKSRARRQRAAIPIPPPKSMRRTSSLPSAQAMGASPPLMGGHAGSSSPVDEEPGSDDEFQFHHWTSRLSPPPQTHTPTSPSLPPSDLAHRDGPLNGALSPTPPPLPLFSYPFPPSPSSPQDDASLAPRPLVIAPHTARANAKAQAARDKRVSIGAAPAGSGVGVRRTSVGRDAKRLSVSRGGEKRDSIVVMRERRVPPKPLGSRGFIALPDSGPAGVAPAGTAAGGAGGYAGYTGMGGVSTGRVVKAVDRMVIRERGLSFNERERECEREQRAPNMPLRSPPLKSPVVIGAAGERPVTREGGRPKSRKGGNVGLGIGGVGVGGVDGGEVVVVGPPLAPPPNRGLPPVPVPAGGRARGLSNAGAAR